MWLILVISVVMAQLQGVIEDIRLFGRWPKRGVKASDAEKQLAKRLSYVLEAMPERVKQELQSLSASAQLLESEVVCGIMKSCILTEVFIEAARVH